MLLRGSSNATKSQISETIENIGARVLTETGREISRYTLQVFKNDVGKAVQLLGDAFTKNTFNSSEFELVKEEASQEHSTSHERFKETLVENVHFNVYREHMMGQPIKGDRDNIHNLSIDTVKAFHANNFIGDNLVVVGTGNINHDEFVS